VLLALTNISNIVVYRYHNTGTWTDDPLLVALEYGLPLIIALVLAFRRVGTRRKGALLKTE
jgi:hypothetical protein